jgi:hypothetical protein
MRKKEGNIIVIEPKIPTTQRNYIFNKPSSLPCDPQENLVGDVPFGATDIRTNTHHTAAYWTHTLSAHPPQPHSSKI